MGWVKKVMAERVITSVDEVTVEWLTAVLSQSTALIQGSVTAFALDTGQGNWSTSANLTLTYSADAQGSLSQRLFLKMVDTDIDDDESFGGSEVTYYTHDYVDVENAPLLRCYDDVSHTHVEAADKTPTLAYGLALAEGLAILHARWWGAERLAEANAPMHSPVHIQRFVDIAEPGVDHILGRFSGTLESHWPDLLRELYARHPAALIRRTQDANGFTLIHGDVGYNNILVSKEGDHPLYIIDRQPFNWSLTTWLGVYDLAYAIILDWDIETRRHYEIPILQHYHQHLIQNGVTNYTWDQLLTDYKLCVPMGVYIATEYCRGGINERRIPVWLPMLQRSLTACDDLECDRQWK